MGRWSGYIYLYKRGGDKKASDQIVLKSLSSNEPSCYFIPVLITAHSELSETFWIVLLFKRLDDLEPEGGIKRNAIDFNTLNCAQWSEDFSLFIK